MGQLYSLGSGRMQPISVEDKNNLPVGRVLLLNGYENPSYAIVKNLGVSKDFPGYGATYQTVNLQGPPMLHRHEAFSMEWIANKKDGRIQMYITDEFASVADLHTQAIENERTKTENQAIAVDKRNQDIERGKQLIEAKMPKWAKAVIVGYQEFDDCELQTDYFATKSGALHILAWSKHTRDIFSEMRKAAVNLEETKHLAIPPETDSNGDKKTDRNKEWWTPSDEHREKYSMGAGYYLKDAHRYNTGWKVEKQRLEYGMDQFYLAAGQGRYVVKS